MIDHLSWRTTYSWQQVPPYHDYNASEPVITDLFCQTLFFRVSGMVFQERFYCTRMWRCSIYYKHMSFQVGCTHTTCVYLYKKTLNLKPDSASHLSGNNNLVYKTNHQIKTFLLMTSWTWITWTIKYKTSFLPCRLSKVISLQTSKSSNKMV